MPKPSTSAKRVHYARTVGLPNLLKLDFQQRAAILKALAKYINDNKEALYACRRTPAPRATTAGSTSKAAAARCLRTPSVGDNELPSGNVVHEGPAMPLGKKGGFAGTHILVPRRGVAVHINAFNFPVWGLLEKFAPTFLAGMPCIGKPATATSYLTEALVRLIDKSGLLPAGALQLVIGGTGDLLDQLDGQDVVTFTGSADTAAKLRVHPNIVQALDPVQRRGRLAELRDPRARRDARRRGVRALRQRGGARDDREGRPEVHRDPPRHRAARSTSTRWPSGCAARLAKTVVGDPSIESVRMGALASHAQAKDVAERVAELTQRRRAGVSARKTASTPMGEGVAEGAFFAPTLLLAREPMTPRRARRGGLRPGEHADAVRRRSTRPSRWPRAAAAAWWARWSPRPGHRRAAWCRRSPRGTAACWCWTARPRWNPPATAAAAAA